MAGLLKTISSKETWDSGDIRSIFFETPDIDISPTIKQIAERSIAWLQQRSTESSPGDFPDFFELSQRVYEIDPKLFVENNLGSMISKMAIGQPSRKADLIEHSFDRVTRYLPDREAVISQSLERKEAVQMLVNLVEQGDWDAIVSLYQGENWNFLAYDALAAFQQGNIKMEQFSTLIFRWSIGKDLPELEIETIPLFNPDGKINEKAKDSIKQTFVFKGLPSVVGSSLDVVSDKHLDAFYERMKKAPQSEQYFFQFRVEDPPVVCPEDLSIVQKSGKDETRTVVEEIVLGTEFNLFNTFFIPWGENQIEGSRRMFPSLSMMQQMLIAFRGDTAVKIVPVMGLSSLEDICQNGILGTREMALPFPTVSLPKKADGFLALIDIDFLYHDFYHAFVASHVPDHARKAFIFFAQIVKQFSNSISGDREIIAFFEGFYERIVDMEVSSYRESSSRLGTNPFLEGILFAFSITFTRLNERFDLPIDDVTIAKRALPKLEPLFVELAAQLNENAFCVEAKIDFDSMEAHLESLRSKIRQFQRQIDQLEIGLSWCLVPKNLVELLNLQLNQSKFMLRFFDRLTSTVSNPAIEG